ncbi:MAG: SMC-Scp complex subunit ScpB [Candidatus Pacebacteria bacterium]|nr:SMC-Scp complex subunit ScpB [Candidatus Paceibacterota bacterium]
MEGNILSKLEALLFIYGEPIEIKKIGKILGLSEEETSVALASLEAELIRAERGLTLMKDGEKVQLATKPEFSNILESLIKQEYTDELTPAALETLSIIVYSPMITRADIEYIRGVNSSFILRSLLMRGLIERKDNPRGGNAYVYKITFDLLKRLGISSNEEVPEFQKYSGLVNLLYQESVQLAKPEAPEQGVFEEGSAAQPIPQEAPQQKAPEENLVEQPAQQEEPKQIISEENPSE